MTDETSKPPVTDSREPGFNPEVEQSHAEEAAALEAEAARAAAADPSSPPPPTYSHRCGACGGMFEKLVEPCAHCGATGTMEEQKA